jgi:hypothetical protein
VKVTLVPDSLTGRMDASSFMSGEIQALAVVFLVKVKMVYATKRIWYPLEKACSIHHKEHTVSTGKCIQ